MITHMTFLDSMFSWLVLASAFLSTIVLAAQESILLGSLLITPALWLIIIGVLVTILSESLSVFHLIGHWGIVTSWVAVIFLIGLRVSHNRKLEPPLHFRLPDFGRWSGLQKMTFLGVITILAITLFCGIVCPPNNYDSMTYHNARVLEWLDHGSLGNYFTSIDRQFRMPPLSSYFRLHLFAMVNNDYLFGAVQWVFFVSCILINAAWAWILTTSLVAVAFTSVFSATLPMAILQSSSTQNDLIVAGYFLAAAFLMSWFCRVSSEQVRKKILVFFWVSIGLGFFTKGTYFIYGTLLILGAYGIVIVRFREKMPFKSLIAMTSVGLVMAGLLNGPFYYRNATFSYNGDNLINGIVVAKRTWTNAPLSLTVKRVTSQVVRATALQFTIFNQTRVTRGLLKASVRGIHTLLALPADDPEIGQDSHFEYFDADYPTHEDFAGSPIHFFAAFSLLAVALFSPNLRKNREIFALFFLAFLSVAAFSIEIKLWPHVIRYTVGALLLFAIPIGVTLTQLFSSKRLQIWIVTGLLASSLPYLFLNHLKPIITLKRLGYSSMFNQTRWDNYFRNSASLQSSIDQVISEIPMDCSKTNPVGLVITSDSWEYPFWIGAARANKDVSFKHIPADSSRSGVCAVISTTCADGSPFCLLR